MTDKLYTRKKRVFLDGHFIEDTVVLAGSGRLEWTLLVHDKLGPTSLTHKIYNYKDIGLKFETKNDNRVDCSRLNLQLNWLIIIVAVCENSHIRQKRTNLVLGPTQWKHDKS